MTKAVFIFVLMSTLGAPENLAQLTYNLSEERNVDPTLVAAIIHTETGRTWEPKAYNEKSGALGLMQISTFWKNYYNLTKKELFKPKTNIKTGIKILKHLQEKFPKKCTKYYSKKECRKLTPLHFYRCSLKGASKEVCHNSVNAVLHVQKVIKRDLNEKKNY